MFKLNTTTIKYLFFSLNMGLLLKTPITKFIRSMFDKFIKSKPQENTMTELCNKYYDNEYINFIKLYDDVDVNNKNVDKEFYNKEAYEENVEKLEYNWRTQMLVENTPRGDIHMYYDAYKLGFAYYSDASSISYNTLNAVAMKYCRVFKCLDLFIDQELVLFKSPLIDILYKEDKKTDKELDKKDNMPFIKPKQKKNTSKIVENKYTNKFINMGKIYKIEEDKTITKNPSQNFSSSLLDNIMQESELQQNVLNYKDYKRNINM